MTPQGRERFHGVFWFLKTKDLCSFPDNSCNSFVQRTAPIPEQKPVDVKVTARLITTSSEPQDLSGNIGVWPLRRSCSGKRYAVGSLSVRSLQQAFQRMARLEQAQVLEGHTDRVWNVAWSPKGTDILWAKPTLLGMHSCWSCI